jgi:hypothetical protein
VSTVYVVGAGASRGETLLKRYPEAHPHAPPLAKGFFDRTLMDAIGYDRTGVGLEPLIRYVRKTRLLDDPFGEGQWKSLDLEEVFTAIEVEREFHSPDSEEVARLLLVRNGLLRHIHGFLGRCIRGARGQHYHLLAERLAVDDSFITFNWDLLLDMEFFRDGKAYGQYGNFLRRVVIAPVRILPPLIQCDGLFLKLHGSLNWFRCGNAKCQANGSIVVADPLPFLAQEDYDDRATCWHCGSFMAPVVIPPLVRKPVTEDPVIRSAWGLARERLMDASRVVVVGFSAAPTDFYASWLLRSTVGTRDDVQVEVVNPCNGSGHDDNAEFARRMRAIFLHGYGDQLCEFSQIESILQQPEKAGEL